MKYRVVIHEASIREVVVEAESDTAAEEQVEEAMSRQDWTPPPVVEVEDRFIDYVEEYVEEETA